MDKEPLLSGTAVKIIGGMLAVGIAWGSLNSRLAAVEEHTQELRNLDLSAELATIKTTQLVIIEDVKEIKEDVKGIRDALDGLDER